MKIRARFIIIASFVLALTSCEKAVFADFTDNFEENRWNKSQPIEYNFEIEQIGNYDLYVDFSHVYGMPYNEVPVRLEMKGPNGDEFTDTVRLQLMDSNNEPVADCSGDFCDLRQAVFQNRKLQSGKYSVVLQNQFEFEYLPNVLGIGIRVTKAKD